MNDLEYYKRRISELEEECVKKQNEINQLEESCGRMKAKVDTYVNYILPRATEEARKMIDNHQYVGIRLRLAKNGRTKEKTINPKSRNTAKPLKKEKKSTDAMLQHTRKKLRN